MRSEIFPVVFLIASQVVGQVPLSTGWFDHVAQNTNLHKVAATGVDFVVSYQGNLGDLGVDLYLRRAQEAGLQVVMELPRPAVLNGDIETVARQVRTFSSRPELRGWYLWDEPDLQKIDPEVLGRTYRLIKSLTDKPVFITLNTINGFGRYHATADVILRDDYPVRDSGANRSPFASGNYLKGLRALAKASLASGKVFGYAVQGYGLNPSGVSLFGRRNPNLKEEQYLLWAAWAQRPAYLVAWAYYRALPSWIEQVFVPSLRDIRETEQWSVVGSRNLNALAFSPDIDVFLLKRSEFRRLILINHSDKAWTIDWGILSRLLGVAGPLGNPTDSVVVDAFGVYLGQATSEPNVESP